ncbi:MAG TPA: threonine synthase [Cyclobacteriaceae bacterium]|nr:threonine synthase [Cyclobacteriaceae bacterium]
MKFYSTNNRNQLVSLQEAVVRGLASDQGLYMPERIPQLPASFFDTLHKQSFQEIALAVAEAFIEGQIPHEEVKKIIAHTISFDAPLVQIEKNIFSLELFHGPTLAFKDFGARFMSHVLSHFAKQQKREVNVLVATSGDTGSAVANGFLGVPGTKVVVLYPSGKVSEIQEKQFTTLGQNITAVEVNGTFDDCQRLVKQAFSDVDLNQKLFLTSANSINIARLIPQAFYYFYAWSRLPKKENIVVSVPSGNFGNLTAGLFAQRMGLPIRHFVASTNRNDIVPKYLMTGKFAPRHSVSTISNAMDVGNPSNLARIQDLFHHNHLAMKRSVTGYSFSDDETRDTMKEVFKKAGYTMDPHGAIGYLGLKKYRSEDPGGVGIFLETAHPAKFLEVVESTLQTTVPVPDKLKSFLAREKKTILCEADFASFKKVIPGL